MSKTKRRSTLCPELEVDIKKLSKLSRQKESLSDEIKELGKEIAGLETTIGEQLGEGNYTVGNILCIVKDKLSKGKATPSWKTVATTIKSTIDIFKFEYVEKFPEATSALNKFAKRLNKKYDETLIANTNVGMDSLSTVVKVERVKKSKK